jgi:hypothetical protein
MRHLAGRYCMWKRTLLSMKTVMQSNITFPAQRCKDTAGHGHSSEVDGAKIPKWYLQRSRLASMHLVRSVHDVLEQGWRQASLRVAGCPHIGTASLNVPTFATRFHDVLRLRNRMSRICCSGNIDVSGDTESGPTGCVCRLGRK